jgi:two-component system nitrate/nitrite sensor histidine kinase NarX
VLRVAREALTNIVRHAQARSVRLGLMYEPAAVTLLVQDDGQGFDPTAEWQGDRFGLRAVSERARVLGATVDVDSLAGWGTRIRARFPYRHRRSRPARGCACSSRRPGRCCGPESSGCFPATEPGLEVVGEVATADQALDACSRLRPDVVLADLGLATSA